MNHFIIPPRFGNEFAKSLLDVPPIEFHNRKPQIIGGGLSDFQNFVQNVQLDTGHITLNVPLIEDFPHNLSDENSLPSWAKSDNLLRREK